MSRDNAEVVRGIYAAFETRDVASVLSLLDPSVEIRQSRRLPWGGEYRGVEQARQFLAEISAQVQSVVTVEHLIDAGESVVAVGWTRGVAIATGKSFDARIAHVWTIANGRVVRFEPYVENAVLLGALAP